MNKLREKVLEAQKCANLSDYIDLYFTEPVAMLFSKLFIKLRIGPNLVTFFSLITGVVGGLFFWPYEGKVWLYSLIGVLLEILSAVFDTSDGQVARLTGKHSEFGRMFDGISDGLVYASIYAGVCRHLMFTHIPFTTVNWGWYIWILGAVCGLYLHAGQANMADYFRTLHIFFAPNTKTKEFTTSKKIAQRRKEKSNSFFMKVHLLIFYTYTKNQEKSIKNTQKMLEVIDEHKGEIPDEMRNDFINESNKVVRTTNLLTFNVRSYVLFILVLCNQHFFIFPFIIFVLEPIKIWLKRKYEKIAKSIANKDYYGNKEIV